LQGGVFLHDELVSVSEIGISAVFPFTDLDFDDGRLPMYGVSVSY
jgi:hypothetical protein